ncbi:hypothetical protein LBO01_06050 [Companilactobacillus paralimentarius]|nr:hypothetical protein LBO01_06050 [Companilactobacillus paralimentarius]
MKTKISIKVYPLYATNPLKRKRETQWTIKNFCVYNVKSENEKVTNSNTWFDTKEFNDC